MVKELLHKIDLDKCEDLPPKLWPTKFFADGMHWLEVNEYDGWKIGETVRIRYCEFTRHKIKGFGKWDDREHISVFYDSGGHDNINVLRKLNED